MKPIAPKRTFSYPEYRNFIDQLFLQGQTTGDNQSEVMLNHTKMNIQRMKRLDKTIRLDEATITELNSITHPQRWILITEAWCGDAAQSVPIIAQMAALNPKIQLDIVLRDENPEIMNRYLTNGAQSIPKLAIFNETQKEIGVWGPRPEPLQKMVIDNKYSCDPIPYSEFSKTIQMWYNTDKTYTIQKEISCMASQCKEPITS